MAVSSQLTWCISIRKEGVKDYLGTNWTKNVVEGGAEKRRDGQLQKRRNFEDYFSGGLRDPTTS